MTHGINCVYLQSDAGTMSLRSKVLVVSQLVMLSTNFVLAKESQALSQTSIDQLSTAQVSNSPVAQVNDDQYDGNSPAAQVNDDQYDGLLGTKQHRFGPSNSYNEDRDTEDEDGQDSQELTEKRKSKIVGFRSDLGKRFQDRDEEDEYPEKRAYRMRGGKAFKADLGKRARGGPAMFRSDLGKRFDSVRSDFNAYDITDDQDESLPTQRRASMFRSDLGKRPAKSEPVRRMFKADLGKRRIQFRHDLG